MDDADKSQGQTQTQQQSQVGGASTLVKERELPAASSAGPSVSEFVRPSGPETEHKIDRELKEMGVESVSETPQLDSQAQQAGVTHAKASVPVQTTPSGHVQVPMTEEEAKQTLKDAKPSESRWGLAAEVLKFFKSIHHGLIKSSKLKV